MSLVRSSRHSPGTHSWQAVISHPLVVITLVAVAVAFTPARAVAQQSTSLAPTAFSISRLMVLARIWGEVKYFHPALATPAISWDSVGAAAISAAERVHTPRDFADVVDHMLDALHDPTTRVIALPVRSDSSSRGPSAGASARSSAARTLTPPSVRWAADSRTDSVLVVAVGSELGVEREDSARRQLAALSEPVSRARRVVVDLRSTDARSSSALSDLLDGSRLDRALLDRSLCGVAPRRRMYVGFPAPNIIGPDLFAGSRQPDAPCFQAGTNVSKQGVVFLIDSMSAIPSIASAMQAAGLATIASTGPVTDEALVALDTIPLAPGLGVQMRLSARPTCSDLGELADTVLMLPPYAQGQGDRAIDIARKLAQQTHPGRQCPAARVQPVAGPSAALANTALPASEWRVLAAFQIYNAIRFFDPHTDLIAGHNWDSVVTANIPAIREAATRHDYIAAISKLTAALNDGHAVLPQGRLLTLFGAAYPPLVVRLVEGKLIVAENFDSSAAPGVHRGDIITSVDGEDARTRFANARRYISGSTPESRDARTSIFFLAGQDSSVATLVVEDAQGRRNIVRVPRRYAYIGRAFGYGKRGPAFRLLSGDVGYADLSLLPPSAVDSMFARFSHTRALIFDLRGYPQGTASLIASRLTERPVVAVRMRVPIIDAPSASVLEMPGFVQESESYDETTQRVTPDARHPYTGRVYVLVDERSISQSEQAALFYKIAGRAILVGSNTAGADGDYTMFTVPGRIGVAFTSLDVRAPDGTPIQGVGLTPDVRVEPTIAGIRAGRDEVLDCALQLATGKTRTCSHSRH